MSPLTSVTSVTSDLTGLLSLRHGRSVRRLIWQNETNLTCAPRHCHQEGNSSTEQVCPADSLSWNTTEEQTDTHTHTHTNPAKCPHNRSLKKKCPELFFTDKNKPQIQFKLLSTTTYISTLDMTEPKGVWSRLIYWTSSTSTQPLGGRLCAILRLDKQEKVLSNNIWNKDEENSLQIHGGTERKDL